MRTGLIPLLLLLACRTATPPVVQAKGPKQPVELVTLQGARSEAFTIATSLCDTVGPRLAGSPGDARAVAWAVETMKRLGLTNVHTEPVTVTAWTRGAERAEITSPVSQPLAIAALGGSIATPENGLEAEVLEVTSIDALKALQPGAATGKILFANIPMRRTNNGAGYGETAGVRRLAGQQGATAGAIAAVIRSVGTDSNRLPHVGGQGLASAAPIPVGALSIPDAELLHRVLINGPVKLKVTLTPKPTTTAQSANVIGEVPGRDRGEEIVLLGAHLDSWDLGTGAHDDGAGVGLVLDTARQLLALPQRPRRTVRVVLFANEENGLAGSVAYAQAHGADHHVLAAEADIGGDRALTYRFAGGTKARDEVKRWNAWLAPLEVRFEDRPAHGGADLGALHEKGVPVFDVGQDASRYFDLHHTANDTVDKLDEAQMTQAARTWATMTWLAAESSIDFTH